jgi:hypothetical protein
VNRKGGESRLRSTAGGSAEVRSRHVAALFSIAVVAVVAWPVAGSPRDDSFPLSTYPMFATFRPTLMTIGYPLGVTKNGERRYLKPAMLGSGEILQAMNVFARARRSGGLPTLCKTVAERVAKRPRFADVVEIRMIEGRHDAVEFLVRDKLGTERELARCPVIR